MPEPFGVLADPRVIGRALPREVQRDLHAEPFGFLAKRDEVLNRPEARFDGGMAARVRSNGPWAARIVRPGDERIVPPLSKAGPDWVDGRQVHDVDPEIRNPDQFAGSF